MKKTVIAIAVCSLFLAFATTAVAGGNNNQNNSNNTTYKGPVDQSTNQGQLQGQAQGQHQGQGQGQHQNATGVGVGVGIGGEGGSAYGGLGGEGGSAVSEGSSANSNLQVGDVNVQVGNPDEDRSLTRSFTDQTIEYSGGYEVKNTPDAFAPSLGATSPCMGSTSIGGSGVGFGFSAGTTWHDTDCTIRETARSFVGMGLNHDAMAVLCSSEYAQAAPSCTQFVEDQIAARASGGVTGVSGERPTTGFRYAPQTGERLCAYDEILAHRNDLMVCPR